MYDSAQPSFLNAVAVAETRLAPLAVLDLIQECENLFGRKRDPERPKGPRSLDVDLLLHGRSVLDSPRLTLPHPGIEERRFVLIPLLELDPTLTSPKSGVRLWRILESLPAQGVFYHAPRAG